MENLLNGTARQKTHGHGKDSHHSRFQKFLVQKVARLENARLWSSYAFQRQAIESTMTNAMISRQIVCETTPHLNQLPKLNEKVNEIYLFHGTSDRHLPMIKEQGLDARISNEASMFGAGCYFAESSSKADQYVSGSTLNMFLCRVVMGNYAQVVKAYNGIRRPSCIQGMEKCTCAAQT